MIKCEASEAFQVHMHQMCMAGQMRRIHIVCGRLGLRSPLAVPDAKYMRNADKYRTFHIDVYQKQRRFSCAIHIHLHEHADTIHLPAGRMDEPACQCTVVEPGAQPP